MERHLKMFLPNKEIKTQRERGLCSWEQHQVQSYVALDQAVSQEESKPRWEEGTRIVPEIQERETLD